MDLEFKPDFDQSLQRIYAWLAGEIIDRPPVQFHRHDMTLRQNADVSNWGSMKERWFDAEFQVEQYLKSIKGRTFLAETFPVFWPNLGPDVYAAFYGIELEYGEVTSWAKHLTGSLDEITSQLKLNWESPYLKKIDEITAHAISKGKHRFLTGYSDFHPGMDTIAAWRDPQELCMDLILNPDEAKILMNLATADFQTIFDYYNNMLKAEGQLSANWMEIPVEGKLHIPSCDFAAMISSEHFYEFCLPWLSEEVKPMDYNIFHLDGKGVARHLDAILEIPKIDAIQWVQGEGSDKPIMQWVELIQKIQKAGKSVLVMLNPNELEQFCSAVNPRGILLSIPSSSEEQEKAILKRIEKWRF